MCLEADIKSVRLIHVNKHANDLKTIATSIYVGPMSLLNLKVQYQSLCDSKFFLLSTVW